MNAYLIRQGLSQPERIVQLNDLAIQQMKVLVQSSVHLLPEQKG